MTKNQKLERDSDFEESKRYEKKRNRKLTEKDSDSFKIRRSESPRKPDDVREKTLEKRKNELEAELLELKKKYAHEIDQNESEISALKERLENTAKNYQDLQHENLLQKQK